MKENFSYEQKIKYYQGRKDNKSLTFGQRKYAKSFLAGAEDSIVAWGKECNVGVPKAEYEKCLSNEIEIQEKFYKTCDESPSYKAYGYGTILAKKELLRRSQRDE